MMKAAEAMAQLQAIQAKYDDADARLEELKNQSEGGGQRDRALAMLDDDGYDAETDPNVEFLRAETAKQEQVVADYRRAAKIARERWERAQREDAVERGRALRPAHQEAVTRIVFGLVETALGLADEWRIRDECRSLYPGQTEDICPVMIPTGPPLGWFDRTRFDSGINRYLREAHKHGYIRGDEEFLTRFRWDDPSDRNKKIN